MVSANGGRELPERFRLHAHYGIQILDRPTSSTDEHRLRVPAFYWRCLLSNSAAGKRRHLCKVSGSGAGNAECSLRRPSCHLSLLQHGSSDRTGLDALPEVSAWIKRTKQQWKR